MTRRMLYTIIVEVEENEELASALSDFANHFKLSALTHNLMVDAIRTGAICTEIQQGRAEIEERPAH